jgi:hypothetical protein
MTGFLLLSQNRVKHRFFNVRFQIASSWIDERVRATATDLRVFGLHVVLGPMIAKLDVARQGPDELERSIAHFFLPASGLPDADICGKRIDIVLQILPLCWGTTITARQEKVLIKRKGSVQGQINHLGAGISV